MSKEVSIATETAMMEREDASPPVKDNKSDTDDDNKEP